MLPLGSEETVSKMANLDNAPGFLLYRPGAGIEPLVKWMTVKASTIVYPGQPLTIATGYVEPGGGTAVLYAIAMGYMSSNASRKNADDTNQDARVLCCIDPWNHEWRTQTDGAMAATDVGKFGIATTTAADTVTKQARNFITYSTLVAAPGDISDNAVFEITEIVAEHGNVAGAYCDIVVRPVRIPPVA